MQPGRVADIVAKAGPPALPQLEEFVTAHPGEEHRLARHHAEEVIRTVRGKR